MHPLVPVQTKYSTSWKGRKVPTRIQYRFRSTCSQYLHVSPSIWPLSVLCQLSSEATAPHFESLISAEFTDPNCEVGNPSLLRYSTTQWLLYNTSAAKSESGWTSRTNTKWKILENVWSVGNQSFYEEILWATCDPSLFRLGHAMRTCTNIHAICHTKQMDSARVSSQKKLTQEAWQHI